MADKAVQAGSTPRGGASTGPDASGALSLGDVEVLTEGGRTLVRLCGEIDLSLSELLAQAYDECVSRARPVRVDASALSFIDSTGIGFLARLAAAEQIAGRRLAVVGASRRTAETLSLTGLGALLEMGEADPVA